MKLFSVLTAIIIAALSTLSVNAQTINSGTSGITAPTGTLNTHTMGDDGHVHVPLQFGFPLYNKVFTNSVMYDNGVVGFFAPATTTTQQVGCDPAVNGYCGGNVWSSQQFSTITQPSWNYMIAPMHTDLRPVASSVYSTQGDTTQMTYRWQNLGEYYNPGNLNTFSLQIKPSGFIGVNYEKVNINSSNVSAGLTGDLSKGEYLQHYYKPAGTIISNQSNMITNWNVTNTGVDQCVVNPLSSPTCAGYTDAMCSTNPLYSTTCSGYQQAYLTQQCTANPLYSTQCPGYATAYLDYQCSIDPLYSTTCVGYEKAYFDKQCSLNSLYSINCPGYETAYHDQQCSIDPLYATDCPNYQQAYFDQQCSISGLYSTSCPNYATAYFSQQCSLNGLYSTQCPNYATAYATWLALQPVTTTNTTTSSTTTTSTNLPTTDSTGAVAVVSDPIVNNTITTTATSASPAQAATAAVPLISTPSSSTTETRVMAAIETKQEEKKTNDSSSTSTTTSTGSSSADNKSSDQPKTARQELQEKREAAAKAKAVESGKNLANEMGKSASMEQQVAVQNVVIQAMGYSPAFEAYKVSMPDVPGYKPYSIYKNQSNVDNRFIGRRLFGGTDQLHNEMINSQYK
jgi:hypothetical protein